MPDSSRVWHFLRNSNTSRVQVGKELAFSMLFNLGVYTLPKLHFYTLYFGTDTQIQEEAR